MCGISGFIRFKKDLNSSKLKNFGLQMSKTLYRRGPDSFGSWVDRDTGVSLSHRRLSIFDTSTQGSQPMLSSNKRFVLVYNGELYNFKELKKKLASYNIFLKTKCDTEVIIESISFWGLKKSLELFNGMFAFAVWDRKIKKLFLVRDRIGIKPLFFYFNKEHFAFASEIKAFRALPWLKFQLDKESITSFVRLNYVPSPFSIYQNIMKIEPGCYAELSLRRKIISKRYWSLNKYILNADRVENIDQEFLTEKTLTSSVSRQLQADVPVGIFLSGGIDSSLVACIAQKISKKPINTFTIGFHESKFDEARFARKISNRIGANHNEEYFSSNHLKDLIFDIPKAYDEPFSDSSQLPTLLLSQLTAKQVTVALSGDGGDELYGGYYRYFMAEKFKRLILNKPKLLTLILCTIIKSFPINFWNFIGNFLPHKFGGNSFGDKLNKLYQILKNNSAFYFQKRIVSNIDDLENLLYVTKEKETIIFDENLENLFPSISERMQLIDTLTYLPDDILTKVDRASMYHSLEVRVPFLDNEVINEAWKIPEYKKIHKGKGKIILRNILNNFMPKELYERPKMGFGIPLDIILSKSLKNEIEYFLNSTELEKTNIFRIDEYKHKWKEHLSGKRNWQFIFWNFLVFSVWYNYWEKKL